MSGHNPLRWNCDRDGCFNEVRRPKIEQFADCFPGKINFGDVDGLVEINGYFALLEWKGIGGRLKVGQEITAKQFTRTLGNIFLVIEGNAEKMVVDRYQMYWNDKAEAWTAGNLDDVKKRLSGWARWARARPRRIA